MRGYLTLMAMITLGLFLSGASIADDDYDDDDRDRRNGRSIGTDAFVGLWEGIDSFDGSTQRLSITCSRRNRCDVRLNDSLFTLSCENQIGFARGRGRIKRGVLSVNLTLTCQGTDGGEVSVEQFNRFVPDLRNRTLTNLNDDPSVPNVFHRISR